MKIDQIFFNHNKGIQGYIYKQNKVTFYNKDPLVNVS